MPGDVSNYFDLDLT